MLLDLASMPDATTFDADVCVVGAGATGIAAALEFVGSGRTVLLLESGGLGSEADTQRLYTLEVVGHRPMGVHLARARVFGGTTTMWGGQSARFDESDFLPRSWVPYSGWPISRAELWPYYERAESVMNVARPPAFRDLCSAFGVEPPAFDSELVVVDCSQWTARPNFATAYGRKLREANNVTVILHANVVELVPEANGTTVGHVEFKALQGISGIARARVYVLCCGAIETSRLLLASNGVNPVGLGNQNDLVGRFFQEHLHIDYRNIVPTEHSAFHDLFEGFFWQGCKQTPKLALSQVVQQREQVLAGHGEVIFEQAADSAAAILKSTVRALKGDAKWPGASALLRAVLQPREVLRLGYRYQVLKRSPAPTSSPVRLGAQVETAPDPDSRVTLGDTRDEVGMRRVRLDWRIGELERRTLSVLLDTISAEFQRLGLGHVAMRRQVIDHLESDSWRDLVHDSKHHMGTTRMSDDPKRGVVDRDCRVHFVRNLYIGSMAVFPTSARSSPTLTAIALSIRVADRIKTELSSLAVTSQ